MIVMGDRAQSARAATVVREGRRAQHRSAELTAALAEPDIARYLAEVDQRWPGLVDSERLRVARILAAWVGVTSGRVTKVLG